MIRRIIAGVVAPALLVAALASCGGPSLPPPLPDRTGLVVQGVHYVGLVVSDLEAATAFYTGPAALEIAQDANLGGSEALVALTGRQDVAVRSRLLRSVNAQLRLFEFRNPSAEALEEPAEDIHGPGFSHVCYQAVKKADVYGQFLAAGGTPLGIRGMLQLSSRNPVDYAYVRDADGTIFEV